MRKSIKEYLGKSMETNSLLIGITGGFGSGKSTAASFFESKGFKKIILSLFLEEEVKRRGFKKITRKILQDIGNEWRKKYGSGILAKKALEYLGEANKNIAIDGIRNPGEIEVLRKNKNFIVLGVGAERKVRFERLKRHKRRESLTWELFERLDRRDLGLRQKKTGLKVAESIAMADIFIENNGTLEEFIEKLNSSLSKL